MPESGVRANQYTVSDFLGWMRTDALTLSPNFQRRPVWSPIAKSLLIDSVVRQFPVPLIILRTQSLLDARQIRREVVDGQQRLRTLIAFIEPTALPNYDPTIDDFTVRKSHNSEIAGVRFTKLPSDIQRRIMEYAFSVQTLPSDASDREVLRIFARLNSTGLKLNAQELRNAEFDGLFKTAMYDIALRELDRWRKWGIFSETQIARMDEVELTSDLVLLMFQGIKGKTPSSITGMYRRGEEDFKEANEVARRFTHIMDSLDHLIGDEIADTVFARETWIHTLFAFLYDGAYGLKSPLSKRIRPRPLGNFRACLLRALEKAAHVQPSDAIFKSLRGATSHAESRNARLNFVRSTCRRA